MSKKVFLYRLKDSDDRDACAYIEEPGRFECGHYFAGVCLHGSCYSGHTFADYDDIETVLTREEYQKLKDYSSAIRLLGYGIKEGDRRYEIGIGLRELIQPVWDKLNSDEAEEFYRGIMESEDEIMMAEHGLGEDDIELIFSCYGLDYHDRSVIGYIFKDSEDIGYEEASSLGYIGKNDSIAERYFDYAQFGEDLVRDDENYVELSDGRVASLSY